MIFQEFMAAIEQAAAVGEKAAKMERETTVKEAEVLERILEKVKPVVQYVDYPIEDGRHHSGHQFHNWKVFYYKERGIILVDNFSQEFTDKDYRGIYTGSQLVLTRSGALVILCRKGEWSKWQGEESYWDAKATEVSPEEAVRRYGFAKIVKGLAEAFKQAVIEAEEKQETLEARLALLEQVRAVLESQS